MNKDRKPFFYMLLATLLLMALLISCYRYSHSYLLGDNNKKIEVTLTSSKLTITKDGITHSYVKRHGEFVDSKNNKTFLSTTEKVLDKQPIKTFFSDTVITRIQRVDNDKFIKTFLKEIVNKKLYVRKVYGYIEYGEDPISYIYYDQDYHIYAIVTFNENQEYIMNSSSSCPYHIIYHKDTLIVSCNKRYSQNDYNIYINGEYLDEDHTLFMSVRRDTTFIDKMPIQLKGTSHVSRIYKTNFKSNGKDVYTSKFSIRRDDTGQELLLRAYYYDNNYNIIKIVEPKMIIYRSK